MNTLVAVLLLLPLSPRTVAGATPATAKASIAEALQVAAASAQGSDPAIDPAKEASIRKLLDLTGASKLMMQTIANMKDSIRPLMLSSLPVGEYREKLLDLFFEKFSAKLDTASLIGLVIPIYSQHLSKDDIDGLIQFYQTPLGQKAIAVLPQIMGEAQLAGKKLGEKAGREAMMEVFDEHPEMRKAVEEAAAATKKQ